MPDLNSTNKFKKMSTLYRYQLFNNLLPTVKVHIMI